MLAAAPERAHGERAGSVPVPVPLAAARRAAEERLRRARPEWEDKRVEECIDRSIETDPGLLLGPCGGGASGAGGFAVAFKGGEALVARAGGGAGGIAALLNG
eukprot:PRCOL_00004150-RA